MTNKANKGFVFSAYDKFFRFLLMDNRLFLSIYIGILSFKGYFEKYLESIANVIINNEPRVKDIENEFWMNCTDVLSIDSFCNIYRERWRNHLYCIKETDFDMDAMLFDDKNRLHQLFAELLRWLHY